MSHCRVCVVEVSRQWQLKNPARHISNVRRWTEEHRERKKETNRLWKERNVLQERERKKKLRAEHPEKCRARLNAWRKKSGVKQTNARLAENHRRAINGALLGNKKAASSAKLLGCSFDEYRAHLESQFSQRPGMSWETRLFWEIDHIKPCSKFDFSDPEQQRLCFHFSNQRPIWMIENRIKHDKYEETKKEEKV